MTRYFFFQTFLFNTFSPHHSGELGLQPCKTVQFIPLSSRLFPDLCPSRSDPFEKLVDNPTRFRLYEENMVSNLHSRQEDDIRP